MIQLCALASGSNGNCYYIGNRTEAVLVDIGISNRQLSKRLEYNKLDIKKIKAIFISHEHTDHVKGMNTVSKKNNIKIYVTKKTYKKINKNYSSDSVYYFASDETINVGNIKIHTFIKQHDAVEPIGFRIEIDGFNIAVLTDLGTVSDNIKKQVSLCDAVFLESNYDYDLLMNGQYPEFLKHRISSNIGHLSNQQALELIECLDLKEKKMKIIFLSHISEENNRVELALNHFSKFENIYNIVPTSRFAATQVYEL